MSRNSRFALMRIYLIPIGAVLLILAFAYPALGLPNTLSTVNVGWSMNVTGAPGEICVTDSANSLYYCTYGAFTNTRSVPDTDTLIFTAYTDGYSNYFQKLIANGITYCVNQISVSASGLSISVTAYFSYTPTNCSGITTTTTASSTSTSGSTTQTQMTTVTQSYTVYSPTTVTATVSGQTSMATSTVTTTSVTTVTTTQGLANGLFGVSLPQILLGIAGVFSVGLGVPPLRKRP